MALDIRYVPALQQDRHFYKQRDEENDMTKTVSTLIAAGAVAGYLMLAAAPAQAQTVVSQGEEPSVLACFYECKEGYRADWWQEVTTLMVMNPTAVEPLLPLFYVFDGNENMIAFFTIGLSKFDIDEVNLCRTLQGAGINPPSAGMIVATLLAGPDPFGPYVYIKNVIGKFFKTVDEPFAGRVTGIGKTECRVVPSSMVMPQNLLDEAAVQNPPVIPPILIEQTADE